MHSECLEAAFRRLGQPYGDFSEDALRGVFEYESEQLGQILFDQEDYYRLGVALRRVGRPVSLWLTATEGLVEDFYGAWDFSDDRAVGQGQAEDQAEDQFRLDVADWGLIFPFP